MTIYARPDELVFAESANPGEVVAFPDIPRGWGLAFDQAEGKPPMEWFNDILRRQDRAIRYLLQRGVPEWSDTDDYPAGAHSQHGGVTYRALIANSGVEPGTSVVTWEPWGLSIATTAQAQALTNDVRALTPKKLGDVTATEARPGIIGITTTAEAQELLNDTRALTSKKLADAFRGPNQSLSGSGFQRCPGGLIEQWAPANFNVTEVGNLFPIAFPNAVACITVGRTGNAGLTSTVTITSSTKTGFNLKSNANSGSYWYRAIGY